ncbi:MAG: AbrB/MazE/SpoVT family DNA-binding domain-containing protein [Proteobacteria bacterium]|nr:AbrB/MazE/SpoVT family DNA-binding domain-containing protein [Pseudomonadota bacterium]MBS0464034.1 AbrB/MazE/SpoVT family DNA-binding domain-containing protein [Pseudomonadota bacterium]
MAAIEKLATTVSTKGQVILPKAIRVKKHWGAGTRLIVEETPEGVLLRDSPFGPPTRLEDVYGSVKYDGPPITLEDMEAGIEAALRERHARGRY